MSEQRSDYGRKLVGLLACVFLGILSSNASADYAAAVLADSPTGYWRFNEPDGDVATNIGTAGDELNGEYLDTPRVPGPDVVDGRPVTGLGADNLAIQVGDDEPSCVTVDASPMNDIDSEVGFTFEGWVNAGPRDFTRIGLWGQNDVPEFGFIDANRIQLWTPGGGNVNWDFTEDDIEDETWFHIAATANDEETLLYINGEEVMVGPGQGNATFGFSDFTFNIGGCGVYDATGNQFLGMIDEVSIWNERVLTDEEIQVHFEAAFEAAGKLGDYNNNGLLDDGDLDIQSQAIKDNDLAFDLTGDGVTDIKDREFWVNDLKNTWMGDADLNGVFDSSDFVLVFGVGKYETEQMAGWAEGDWNGDMLFNTSDFVVVFANGGFEMGPMVDGPNPATAAVPEPSSIVLLLLGTLMLLRHRK